MIELSHKNILYEENGNSETRTTVTLCTPKGSAPLHLIVISKLVYSYLYSLVIVDGVGVLVMDLLVTVHAAVGIVAVTVTAEKEAT